MKLKKFFNYSHYYNKLCNDEFTTIRGRSAIGSYEVGQLVENRVEGACVAKAEILRIVQKRICDIEVSELCDDAAYDGYSIDSRQDFIDLLNSFRRFNKIKDANEIVTIFYMKRIE